MALDRLMELCATEYTSRAAIQEGDKTFSYAQLAQRIRHWQQVIAAQSLAPGTVGIVADFGFEAISFHCALLMERKIVALLPRDKEVVSYLRDAHVGELISIDGDALSREPCVPSGPHPQLDTLSSSGDAGIVIFSSGSAGAPKAALHSATRFLNKFQRRARPMRTLAFLMFDHVAGQDTLFYTLFAGGTLVTLHKRDPQTAMATIKEAEVEVLPTSPTFLRLMCATTDFTSADVPSLKVITFGSEPMDPATLRQLNERFFGVSIIQKYGTTETGSPPTESRTSGSLWLRFKTDAEGKAPHEIRDDILWLRSSGTLLCYLNAANPVQPDGWYCTGDRVEQDGEWIRILGRQSELINVGGEKVSPAEVEDVIREIVAVSDVQVIGEANALVGSIVAAKIVLKTGCVTDTAATTREIRRHCRARLASYKVPVKIDFVDGIAISTRMKRATAGVGTK